MENNKKSQKHKTNEEALKAIRENLPKDKRPGILIEPTFDGTPIYPGSLERFPFDELHEKNINYIGKKFGNKG